MHFPRPMPMVPTFRFARAGQAALPSLSLDTPVTDPNQNLLFQIRCNATGNPVLHIANVNGDIFNPDAQKAARYIQGVIGAPVTGTLTQRVMNALLSGRFGTKTDIEAPVLAPSTPSPAAPVPTFPSITTGLPLLPLTQTNDLAITASEGLDTIYLPAGVTRDPKTFIVYTLTRGGLTPDGQHLNASPTAVVKNGVVTPLPKGSQILFLETKYITSIIRGSAIMWKSPTLFQADAARATEAVLASQLKTAGTAPSSSASSLTPTPSTTTAAPPVDSEKLGSVTSSTATAAHGPSTLPIVPILIGAGVLGAAVYFYTRSAASRA